MRTPLRHFSFFSPAESTSLFHRQPEAFHRDSDQELLSVALGATLYMPATRPGLAADLAKQTDVGAMSVVVCLEDAVAGPELPAAEHNLVAALHAVDESASAVTPMIFIRVRHTDQILELTRRFGPAARSLSGFVLPKFTAANGPAALDAVRRAAEVAGRSLWAMPVLETPEVLHLESRRTELTRLGALLAQHRARVLAVRIGATDLSALHGLRRSRQFTVYDVKVIADVVADIVNVLGRADGTGFTVTGPVWEYFTGGERLFKPQLRTSPFDEHDALALRTRLVSADLDGLIREVELDRANGLTGKTVIHPTHVSAVHALSVVPVEEYRDALDILDAVGGGVIRSGYGNKMNEVGPHSAWARRTLLRADVFGVAAPGVSFVDLLTASLRR